MADRYVGFSDEERALRLGNIAASNKAKRDEQEALAKRHETLDKLEFQKQQEEAAIRANDLARQKLMTSLIARGTNSIDAFHEAGKVYPFSKPSEQLAVEEAYQKAHAPQVSFGDATRQFGDQTVYGQTNQAGRFFPISVPRPPKAGEIKLQVEQNGNANDFLNTPIPNSTNVLKTLPPDLQTNQFNTAAMASIPSTPAPAPAPQSSFFSQAASNPPLPTPAPVSTPIVQEVSRLTPDGRTAIFDANTRQFLRYANTN